MITLNESMFCVSRRSTDTSAIYVSALCGGFMNEKDRQVIALVFTYCLALLSRLNAWLDDVSHNLLTAVYDVLVQPHVDDSRDRQQLRQYRHDVLSISYPSGLTPTVQVVQPPVIVLHDVPLSADHSGETDDPAGSRIDSICPCGHDVITVWADSILHECETLGQQCYCQRIGLKVSQVDTTPTAVESLPMLTEKDIVPIYRRTKQGKNVRYVPADRADCGETLYLKKGKRYVEIG